MNYRYENIPEMNRLKKEVVTTELFFISSVAAVALGYFINYDLLIIFGIVMFAAMILYSIYLKKQIKAQKEDNQRRKNG